MNIETTALSFIFDLDNWAKDKICNELNYPAVTVEKDIVYSDKNPKVNVLDAYYNPTSAKWDKYPVVLNIHGGGWIIGDKRNSAGTALQLADNGVFFINMNYGMPPKAVGKMFETHDPSVSHSADYVWPYPIENAFDALQWIYDNAETYNLDLDNVFLSGDSAGGHLGLCVETALANPEYREKLGLPESPIKLKGAFLFSGMYDVGYFYGLDMNKVPIARCMMQELTGKKDAKSFDKYDSLIPMSYFTKDMPRTLLVTGMVDLFTINQSERVKKKLEETGVQVDFYKGKGLTALHDFQLLTPTRNAYKVMSYTAKWLDEVIGVK